MNMRPLVSGHSRLCPSLLFSRFAISSRDDIAVRTLPPFCEDITAVRKCGSLENL
jgi:hypothetical protein